MKPFGNTIRQIVAAVNGRECTFDEKDDRYLAQFGIRRITKTRNTADFIPDTEKTDLDRAKEKAGFTGCNDSYLQDFVCEKDGVQFNVFIFYGVWQVGFRVLHEGCLTNIKKYVID